MFFINHSRSLSIFNHCWCIGWFVICLGIFSSLYGSARESETNLWRRRQGLFLADQSDKISRQSSRRDRGGVLYEPGNLRNREFDFFFDEGSSLRENRRGYAPYS